MSNTAETCGIQQLPAATDELSQKLQKRRTIVDEHEPDASPSQAPCTAPWTSWQALENEQIVTRNREGFLQVSPDAPEARTGNCAQPALSKSPAVVHENLCDESQAGRCCNEIVEEQECPGVPEKKEAFALRVTTSQSAEVDQEPMPYINGVDHDQRGQGTDSGRPDAFTSGPIVAHEDSPVACNPVLDAFGSYRSAATQNHNEGTDSMDTYVSVDRSSARKPSLLSLEDPEADREAQDSIWGSLGKDEHDELPGPREMSFDGSYPATPPTAARNSPSANFGMSTPRDPPPECKAQQDARVANILDPGAPASPQAALGAGRQRVIGTPAGPVVITSYTVQEGRSSARSSSEAREPQPWYVLCWTRACGTSRNEPAWSGISG